MAQDDIWQASLEGLAVQTQRLLSAYRPRRIARERQDTKEKEREGVAAAPSVRHLFRLFLLDYPSQDVNMWVNEGRPQRVRLVAVSELGLYPRGALLEDVELSAQVWVPRLQGPNLHGDTAELVTKERTTSTHLSGFLMAVPNACRIIGRTPLSALNGRGQLDVVLDPSLFSSHTECYVHIAAGNESILDALVGPISTSSSCAVDNDRNAAKTPTTVEVHRLFVLSGTKPGMSSLPFHIQEQWGNGMPGKIWDSAIALGQYLVRNIPTVVSRFSPGFSDWPEQILDLSTGTGYLGVLLAQIFPKASITCTDLPEALPLISANCGAFANIDVRPLSWGNSLHDSQGRTRKQFDLLVCSDLLYESDIFEALAATIRASLAPNGLLVLAYKSRGLTPSEEDEFFSKHLDPKVFALRDLILAPGGYGTLLFICQRL